MALDLTEMKGFKKDITTGEEATTHREEVPIEKLSMGYLCTDSLMNLYSIASAKTLGFSTLVGHSLLVASGGPRGT